MKPEHAGRSRNGIQLEKVMAHSPEQVWQALTDPHALAQWLLPTTFKPRRGHRFRFTRMSDRGKPEKVRCQVVELDAPRRLAYTWQAESEDAPTLVTWTLEAVAEGTCLRLEHTGMEMSCAYLGGSNKSVVNHWVCSLALFLSSSGLQAGQIKTGRIALQGQRTVSSKECYSSLRAYAGASFGRECLHQ